MMVINRKGLLLETNVEGGVPCNLLRAGAIVRQTRLLVQIFLVGLAVVGLAGCASTKSQVGTETLGPVAKRDFVPVVGRDALAQAIDTILQDQALAQTFTGVSVVEAESGAVLYESNSQKLFHPASNMKLFSTALALQTLGPQYRFKTRLACDSSIAVGDTLAGNLYLIGAGDPAFSLGDLATLVEQLRSRGVRFVAGNIICDDFFLDDMRYGEGWMWDDQPGSDFAPIGALSINGNCVDFWVSPGERVGAPAHVRTLPLTNYLQIVNTSVTTDSTVLEKQRTDSLAVYAPLAVNRRWRAQDNIVDVSGMILQGTQEQKLTVNVVEPSLFFGTLFREYCERAGIIIAGGVARGFGPRRGQTLAMQVSDELSTLVLKMNKPSDNLFAEHFLKVVGARVYGAPGSATKGKNALRAMLASWGIDTTAVQFSDGSGVSRYNLVSPAVLTSLLRHMYNDFAVRSELIASLPIGGLDGTLAGRMRSTAAYGVVHAKTGSLNGVSTLSGFTTNIDGKVLAFSLMMANFVGETAPIRTVQDRICDVLTRYRE